MEPLFDKLYPDGISDTIKTRLSNSYLIGEIFGMLFFGFLIDKIGRRTGVRYGRRHVGFAIEIKRLQSCLDCARNRFSGVWYHPCHCCEGECRLIATHGQESR